MQIIIIVDNALKGVKNRFFIFFFMV